MTINDKILSPYIETINSLLKSVKSPLKNVIVVARSDEELQGMIRGIEALNTEFKVGIIYGCVVNDSDNNTLSEAVLLLAQVTNASFVLPDTLQSPDSIKGIEVLNDSNTFHYIHIPTTNTEKECNREVIIEYMKENYSDLIEEILKG